MIEEYFSCPIFLLRRLKLLKDGTHNKKVLKDGTGH